MRSTLAADQPFTEEDLREMVLRLAHEIRNPLATIKSAAQLLEHLQKPEGEIAEFYSSIHTEIDRIDMVVRDMHRYARLDIDTAKSVDVGESVRTAVEAEFSENGEDGDRVEIIEGPATLVLMDQAQLESALCELLSNGIRFSPPVGRIRVFWQHHDRAMVQIHVDDSGPGISYEVEQNMLRPFFSTSTQGTGLGLNIVARTAQLSGGSLRWQNLEGGGARFTITVPRM
ncbi:MAG: HAMP domain-containing histidine kinase [bacterium]|nr:HAMP domain-containing histidine kinase [bacterium]